MLAKTYSYGIIGLDAYPITIETDVSRGLPGTTIVGLPDNAVKESKERVRSAIKNSGFSFSLKRITINLSPADTKKEGPLFDLAMALGILTATNTISSSHLADFAIIGELSLDGSVRPIKGILPIALSIKENNIRNLILPTDNFIQASIVDGINLFPVKNLLEAVQILSDPNSFCAQKPNVVETYNIPSDLDFSDVKGQRHVKRALEVAAAGAHNVIMVGPPGSGKSMLAKRLPSILPDMTLNESLEATRIHSVMGTMDPKTAILRKRPFRSPHHTTSDIAIVGGGSSPRPGEITLSHNGVLFLDELPEFSRKVLETLRQPLEDRYVSIARAIKSVKFPANFMLICAMNPCPCGFLTEPRKVCHCSPLQIQRYLSKISGPLLDRIDIHIEVPALASTELLQERSEESSSIIKTRTIEARQKQSDRFKDKEIYTNSQMSHKDLKTFCVLNSAGQEMIKGAIQQLGLSARAYDKILKIARTIADLDGKTDIDEEHVAEAIQYRSLDRNYFV